MAVGYVFSIRVGVISDLHTNTMFDANSAASSNQVYVNENSVSDNCWATGPLAEQPSPWARYGCDPSADLVEAML